MMRAGEDEHRAIDRFAEGTAHGKGSVARGLDVGWPPTRFWRTKVDAPYHGAEFVCTEAFVWNGPMVAGAPGEIRTPDPQIRSLFRLISTCLRTIR